MPERFQVRTTRAGLARCLCLLLAFVAAGAGSVSGQLVRGTVTDAATNQPIWGVLVTALARQDTVVGAALTDSAGRYSLKIGGRLSLRLRTDRLGYERFLTEPMGSSDRDSLRLDLKLIPSPIRLPEVVAQAKSAGGNLAGFLRRREIRKFGQFMGPDEIAAIRPLSGDHLLSLFTWIDKDPSGPGILGRAGVSIRPGLYRGISAANPPTLNRQCHPWIYIDGRPMEFWRVGYFTDPAFDSPTSTDFFIPVSSIRGVEVYRYWYDAPAQYVRGTGRDCSIILLWTDYGFGFREKARAPK